MPEHRSYWPDKEYFYEVATQVADLFPTGSSAQGWLRKQIALVIDQQKAHDQAVPERKQALAEHYRMLQRNPSLRSCDAGPPKQHPNWRWAAWFAPVPDDPADVRALGDEDVEPVEGWGPEELLDESSIPSEPIHWLYPFGDRGKPPEEVLPAYCFILAAVHDIALSGKGFALLLDRRKLPSALLVYLDFQTADGGGMQMTGFDRDTIGLALKATKAALRGLATPRRDGPQPALSKEALVIAALKDHPDWTDRRIAKSAGCHPKSLYRMKAFKKAKEALRQGRADIPRGSKSEDGTIEAWDDTKTDDSTEPSDS